MTVQAREIKRKTSWSQRPLARGSLRSLWRLIRRKKRRNTRIATLRSLMTMMTASGRMRKVGIAAAATVSRIAR